MSRSALQKEFLKKQQQMLQPVPPPQYLQMQAQQQQYYMQYQAQQAAMMGMHAMPGVDTMQPAFVPIPLTGDDDDNEGPTAVKSNVLPMYGNTSNYNINSLLYNNIMENEYFRALYQLRTYHEVIDEIYRSVDHVEPWQTGTARFPSSAFCLLVKFMLMKLTLKQMNGLLATSDCANVRAIGLLYLRYTCPPADLYKWYEPYLEDNEEFSPGADKSVTTTIGEYCTKLLTDMQYYGTTLPRIPVPIERKIKVFLLLLEEKKKRRRSNMRDLERGLYCVGAKVRAIYSDDTNEPAWYEAVIDSVDEESADGTKFWVTYPEYGNSAKVDLGDMELLPAHGAGSAARRDGGATSGEARRNSASRSRSRDRGGDRDDRDRRADSRDRDHDRAGGGRGRDRRDGSRDRGGRRDDDRRGSSRDRRRDRHERDDSRDRDKDRDGGRRRDVSGSRDRDDQRGGLAGAAGSSSNLLEQVLQSQREASAAVGKNYGQRPASYKGSLSLKHDRYTVRRKSPSPDRRRRRSRSRSPQASSRPSGSSSGAGLSGSHGSSSNLQHSSAGGGGGGGGGGAEQADRMRMLKARYGDASATTKRRLLEYSSQEPQTQFNELEKPSPPHHPRSPDLEIQTFHAPNSRTMWKWIPRNVEPTVQKWVDTPGSVILVRGHRRSGKSSTVKYVTTKMNKQTVAFYIVPNDHEIVQMVNERLQEKIAGIFDFGMAIARAAKSGITIVLEEIQNSSNSLLVSLQAGIDWIAFDSMMDSQNWSTAGVIFLMGSLLSLVDTLVDSRTSALYQRITAKITIFQFNSVEFCDMMRNFDINDPDLLLSLHSIFGGKPFPYYIASRAGLLKGNNTDVSAIVKEFFASELQSEVEDASNHLEVQLGKRFSVAVKAVAGYKTKSEQVKKISEELAGEDGFEVLQELHKRYGVIEPLYSAQRPKIISRYEVCDPLTILALKTRVTFVTRREDVIHEAVLNETDLQQQEGLHLERWVREIAEDRALLLQLPSFPVDVVGKGKVIFTQRLLWDFEGCEIDLIASVPSDCTLIVGSCKRALSQVSHPYLRGHFDKLASSSGYPKLLSEVFFLSSGAAVRVVFLHFVPRATESNQQDFETRDFGDDTVRLVTLEQMLEPFFVRLS